MINEYGKAFKINYGNCADTDTNINTKTDTINTAVAVTNKSRGLKRLDYIKRGITKMNALFFAAVIFNFIIWAAHCANTDFAAPPFLSSFISTRCDEAYAAPLTFNTRTLEVKLRYKTINEINISSSFAEDDTRFEGGAALFETHRNSRKINDFLVFDDAVLLTGDFGAHIDYSLAPQTLSNQTPGGASSTKNLFKYKNSFKILNGASCFGAEISASAFDGLNFYFGTKGGDLIELSDVAVRHISIISTAGRFSINKLKTHKGVLLILTEGGGLYTYYKNRIFKIHDRSHGLYSNDINDAVIFEKDDITYAALALSNGAAVLQINDFETNDIHNLYSFKSSSPVDAVAYSDGAVYAGGAFGMERIVISPAGFEKSSVLKDIFVTSIAQKPSDDNGSQADTRKLIISTYSSGIYTYDCAAKTLDKIIPQSKFNFNNSGEGINSVKCYGGDLFLFSKKSLFKYGGSRLNLIASGRDGYSDKITALCPYSGYLFCATFDGGVFIYDEGRVTGFNSLCDQKLSAAHINALAEFDGKLLIGSIGGLDIFDYASRRLLKLKNAPASPRINAIHASPNAAFIGTSDGISVLKKDLSVENISIDPALIDRRVYCLYYDKNSDIIYFGTYRGFGEIKYESRRLKTYFTINSALPDNWITSITPYGADSLLVATYDRSMALFNMRKKKFTPFGAKNTLPSKMVNANAVFNFENYIFAGTYNGGLAIIDTAAGGASRHFNTRNGLASNMVTSFTLYKDCIAAGTFGGLAIIKQKEIKRAFE